MLKKVHLALLGLAAILIIISILGNQNSYAETFYVAIRADPEGPSTEYPYDSNGYAFHPEEITVDVGTTVVWTNMDYRNHAIVSGKPNSDGVGAFFSSDWLKLGKKFSHTFNNEGHFPYFTATIPYATGKVIVKGESNGSTIVLSSNSGLPGEKIIIQGTGFAPTLLHTYAELTIKFDDRILETTKLVLDDGGFFITSVWLPSDVSAGAHEISVKDVAGNRASAGFTVWDFTKPEWKTVHAVGTFLNSKPPKPDQIFKIQYRIINGTIEKFNVLNMPDKGITGDIVAEVTSAGNGRLEIQFPRNYPYTNSENMDAKGSSAIILINGRDAEFRFGITDCFFLFSIPFTVASEIQLAWTYILVATPYHGDYIPYQCILQTVDVPVREDGTISSLHQFRAGVKAEDIVCKEGLELIIKPNGKPYCVTPSTAKELNELWN